MRSGEKNVPDLYDWILQNLAPGQRVGIDAWLFQGSVAKSYSTKFADKGISLVPFDVNPVDIVWKDFGRPSYPSSPVEVVPLSRAGISHLDKIRSLQEQLLSNGTGALLVTMLDEIAWVLNVRGADVEYNPVVISYLVITLEGAVWFVDEVKVTDEAREHLTDKVAIKAYNEVENFLKTLVQAGTKVWVDSMKTNWRLCEAVGSQKLEKMSPVTLPKSIKNSAELDGFRASHIRDGAALTAFIHWLEMTTKANPDGLTEFDASEKLEEFRSRMDLHVGPSFPTIAGFGPNGAIIHYRPEKDTASKIGVDSIFLLDSGAQYRDGTTDVTR
jgi:Xaa-Pro aminopeptidase